MQIASTDASSDAVQRVLAKVAGFERPKVRHVRKKMRGAFAVVATGTVLSIGVVALIFAVMINTASEQAVFAAMKDRVQEARSVQYTEVMNEVEARRELEELNSLLDKILVEMKATGSETEPPHVAGVRRQIKSIEDSLKQNTPIVAQRVWIQGRYLQRSEQYRGGARSIHIFNAETGETVTLYPDDKRCVLMKTQTVINMQSGEKATHQLKPEPHRNLYAQICDIPSKNVVAAGERDIKGRAAIGFEQTEFDNGFRFVRTYWVDKDTRLLVEITVVVRRDEKVITGSTLTDFVFDQELNAGLFNMEPPEGYEVSEGGFMSLDPGTLQD